MSSGSLLCQGAKHCGCISPKAPRLKGHGLVFLLCVSHKILSWGWGRNCLNPERKTLFMQRSALLSGNTAFSVLFVHNWGVQHWYRPCLPGCEKQLVISGCLWRVKTSPTVFRVIETSEVRNSVLHYVKKKKR